MSDALTAMLTKEEPLFKSATRDSKGRITIELHRGFMFKTGQHSHTFPSLGHARRQNRAELAFCMCDQCKQG